MSETNEKNVTLGTNQQRVNSVMGVDNIPAHLANQIIDDEFIVPTDDIQLPSEGRFYPNGQDTVKIKYLTAEDENILLNPDLIRSNKTLDVLLENAIIDKTLRPQEMLSGDRNAVLLSLRSTGYGDEWKYKTACKECGKVDTQTVLISKLKMKTLKANPDESNEFYVELPKSKVKIKFRLLTGADESMLSKKADSQKKKINKSTSFSTTLTQRYLLQIMEVNGQRNKLFVQKFISSMPIFDSAFLREYISGIEPGVDMNYEFECKECGHVYEEELVPTVQLFWPNAKMD